MWSGKLLVLSTMIAMPVYSAQLKTGAEFLNIPVGARSVGMGSAYTSMANDVTALHWNPAGLSHMKQREFGAMHSQWLFDMRYNFIGFGSPTKLGTIAGSVTMLSQGGEEARGSSREKKGTIKAQDRALSLGMGRKVGRIHVGAGMKLLQSQIAQYKAQTMALDMGVMYPMSNRVNLGVSLMNLGPGMQFISQRDPLPLTLATGISMRMIPGLAIAMDARHRMHTSKTDFTVGTEYALMPTLSIRGGYLAELAQNHYGSSTGGLPGLSAGAGFKLNGYAVDYSFTPFGLLGDTHRISLGFKF